MFRRCACFAVIENVTAFAMRLALFKLPLGDHFWDFGAETLSVLWRRHGIQRERDTAAWIRESTAQNKEQRFYFVPAHLIEVTGFTTSSNWALKRARKITCVRQRCGSTQVRVCVWRRPWYDTLKSKLLNYWVKKRWCAASGKSNDCFHPWYFCVLHERKCFISKYIVHSSPSCSVAFPKKHSLSVFKCLKTRSVFLIYVETARPV